MGVRIVDAAVLFVRILEQHACRRPVGCRTKLDGYGLSSDCVCRAGQNDSSLEGSDESHPKMFNGCPHREPAGNTALVRVVASVQRVKGTKPLAQ